MDYSEIIGAVDYLDVVNGLLHVIAALAALQCVLTGCRALMRAIEGDDGEDEDDENDLWEGYDEAADKEDRERHFNREDE